MLLIINYRIMRVFLSVLILIFSLQSLIKADDISDFEIENISLGDSLLYYMSKEEIISNEQKVTNRLFIYELSAFLQ